VEAIVVTSGYSSGELARIQGLADQVIVLSSPAQVSESRNRGAQAAGAPLVAFVDDDNVLDETCLAELAAVLDERRDVALVGPAMYYLAEPERLWCAGVSRSRLLMRTHFRTSITSDMPTLLPTDDLPNCFMVRRKQFLAIGGFDAQTFPRHFEESDLARRLERDGSGRAVVCLAARVWHDISPDLLRRMHMTSPQAAYLIARSRNLFADRYATSTQRRLNRYLGRWIFAAVYVLTALRADRSTSGRRVAWQYLRGAASR
jgi:GT2 family glycosyltransferase